MANHPPCGLYRTALALPNVPAGRLVSFHNHGDPGAGIYLPKRWVLNRVEWHANGATVPGPEWSSTLEPLAAEGLYAVQATFFCCSRQCVRFNDGQLVQLGYDGEATPILFVPELTAKGLGFPESGTRLDRDRIARLTPLKVARGHDAPVDTLLH
ncbi:MAG: hypothetical protein JNG84_14255 [Archangium sp.]|nr:hypothetical protein [Archangium sp.]